MDDEIDRKIDVTAMQFYWFRIDTKQMTKPWLDQALMAYKCEPGLLSVGCRVQGQTVEQGVLFNMILKLLFPLHPWSNTLKIA